MSDDVRWEQVPSEPFADTKRFCRESVESTGVDGGRCCSVRVEIVPGSDFRHCCRSVLVVAAHHFARKRDRIYFALTGGVLVLVVANIFAGIML